MDIQLLREWNEKYAAVFNFEKDGQTHSLDSILENYIQISSPSFDIKSLIEGCDHLSSLIVSLTESYSRALSLLPWQLAPAPIKQIGSNANAAVLMVDAYVSFGVREKLYSFVKDNYDDVRDIISLTYSEDSKNEEVELESLEKVRLILRLIQRGHGPYLPLQSITHLIRLLYTGFGKYSEYQHRFTDVMFMDHLSHDNIEEFLLQSSQGFSAGGKEGEGLGYDDVSMIRVEYPDI